MTEQASKNLSETLFENKKQTKETSSLTPYMPSSQEWLDQKMIHGRSAWYRNLRKIQWLWQGIDPIELEMVLAKIASSENSRTHDKWLDTVTGYRSGNWTFEWSALGMEHQKNSVNLEGEARADELFNASLCYSIAGYPHLNSDNLASQAQLLAHKAYEEAATHTSHKIIEVKIPYKNKHIKALLHLPHTERPLPTVIVSAGLDSLQTDMWRLYRDHFAPREIAMITVDMPSVGYSKRWSMTEETSLIHQAVLNHLPTLAFVNHQRVGVMGFRFGGNALARLSFLEQSKVRACVSIGAPIHDVLSSPQKVKQMSKMYLDVLSNRIGKSPVDINSLSAQLGVWSLKKQGFFSGRKTAVPILALSMDGDFVSPESDNRSLAFFSQGGKVKQISSKSITQGYEQSLDLAIKWFEEQLLA